MAEILVVDDDRNLRETLGELLEGAGYRIRTAANGSEAISLLQASIPDLTLCDWKMPGVGGEQFL
jgi:CheY-like chemotaxis protein